MYSNVNGLQIQDHRGWAKVDDRSLLTRDPAEAKTKSQEARNARNGKSFFMDNNPLAKDAQPQAPAPDVDDLPDPPSVEETVAALAASKKLDDKPKKPKAKLETEAPDDFLDDL